MSASRRILFALFCGFFVNTSAFSQSRFEPPTLTSNRLQLTLLGETNSAYAIERSTNLATWLPVFTDVAQNGRLLFDAGIPTRPGEFFRARPATNAPTNFVLQPIAQSNYTSSAYITSDGGSTMLFAANGGRFTLTFPSNTIADASLVTVQIVTNLAGLPFSGGVIGAVRIESEEPDFLGAAVLTISLSSNIDRRRIVSFSSALDGTEFTLAPDRVGSNLITIPISRTGIYGSALATTQEIAAVVQVITNQPDIELEELAPSPSPSKKPTLAQSIMATSRACFPTEVAEAVRIRNRIKRALNRMHAEIAGTIAAARQAQLSGDGDTSQILENAGPASCAFYRKYIEPHWPATSGNCALSAVLLEAALGLERQMQTLGVPDAERCTANVLSAELLCPAFKRCLEEVKLCCMSGNRNRQRMIDLFTMVRQQQILGISGAKSLGCFDSDDSTFMEATDVCTPIQWIGSVHMQESGFSYETTPSPNGYSEERRVHRSSYSGYVSTATDQIIPGLGLNANLTIDGNLIVDQFSHIYSEADNNCGINIYSFDSEESGNDSAGYKVFIAIQPPNYTLTIIFYGHEEDHNVAGNEHNETVNISHGGIGCSETDYETIIEDSPTQFIGSSLVQFTGPLGSNTNSIAGTTDFPGRSFLVDTSIKFKWNLQRRKIGQ